MKTIERLRDREREREDIEPVKSEKERTLHQTSIRIRHPNRVDQARSNQSINPNMQGRAAFSDSDLCSCLLETINIA